MVEYGGVETNDGDVELGIGFGFYFYLAGFKGNSSGNKLGLGDDGIYLSSGIFGNYLADQNEDGKQGVDRSDVSDGVFAVPVEI